MNGDRSKYNNQFEQSTCCHMYLARKGTTTVKNANHTVGTSRSMLQTSPPWGHRHGTPPRTGNGMPKCSAQLLQLQKPMFILERYFPKLVVSQRKGFLHPTDRMCLPMLHPIFTQSCGKETPCGKSPSHTRVGLQALLDRVTVFAGLRTTLNFNVRQIFGTPLRLTYHSQFIRHPLARWFTLMLWIT